jgi:hypothetical protein
MTKKNIYYFIMIPFLVFHCLVLAFLVYRITTYYYCFLNSIDFCTTIILLTKYPNLEWVTLDQVDALWYWWLNIKTCMVKVALKFKTPKNNQAIYKYDNVSFHGFNDKKICRSHDWAKYLNRHSSKSICVIKLSFDHSYTFWSMPI